MRHLKLLLVCSLAALASCRNHVREAGPQPPPAVSPPRTITAGAFRLSGPYTYKNLTIYLVHGSDGLPANYLTLQEAMELKQIRVHETGSVNELAVENVSDKWEIFIQAGDIVRGGKQDRVLAVDLIVPPKSGPVKIAAFCVESGRWTARGGESGAYFGRSEHSVGDAGTLYFMKAERDQGMVWQRAAENQRQLSGALDADVRDARSASSLELTLGNPKVEESVKAYLDALAKLIEDKPDVIGYVCAVNGEVSTADLYGAHALFAKLWPRLLRASAVAAIAAPAKAELQNPTLEQVHAFLVSAEDAQASEQQVPPRVRLVTRKSDKCVLFDTFDQAYEGSWVHRNCIKQQQAPGASGFEGR